MMTKSPHPNRIAAIAIGTALMVVAVFMVVERYQVLEKKLGQTIEIIADMMVVNGAAIAVYGDREDATLLLASVAQFPEVRQAAIYDARGEQLGALTKPGNPHPAPPTWTGRTGTTGIEIDPAGIRVAHPVKASGKTVGTIVLWGGMYDLYRELFEFVLSMLAAFGISGVIAYLGSAKLRNALVAKQHTLETSRALIQELNIHRENILSEEHRKISQELHDGLGQLLGAALLELGRLGRNLKPTSEKIGEQIEQIREILEMATNETRHIATSLRPPVLNVGFFTAVEWLVEKSLKNTAIQYQMTFPAALPDLKEEISLPLFRILQEGIANVLRHARAKHVQIRIGVANGRLEAEIVDDGIGFSLPAVEERPTGLGLLGMRERVQAMSGKMEISSQPNKGTRIRISVPIDG